MNKPEVKIGFPPALFLFTLFFLAKVFNLVSWSWFWVFSPLWIPFGLILACLLIIILIEILSAVVK